MKNAFLENGGLPSTNFVQLNGFVMQRGKYTKRKFVITNFHAVFPIQKAININENLSPAPNEFAFCKLFSRKLL